MTRRRDDGALTDVVHPFLPSSCPPFSFSTAPQPSHNLYAYNQVGIPFRPTHSNRRRLPRENSSADQTDAGHRRAAEGLGGRGPIWRDQSHNGHQPLGRVRGGGGHRPGRPLRRRFCRHLPGQGGRDRRPQTRAGNGRGRSRSGGRERRGWR